MKFFFTCIFLLISFLSKCQNDNKNLDASNNPIVHCDNLAIDLLKTRSFRLNDWDSIQIELKSKIAQSKIPFAEYYFKQRNDSIYLIIESGKAITKTGFIIDGIKSLPNQYKSNLLKLSTASKYVYDLKNLTKTLTINNNYTIVKEPQLLYFEDSAVIYTSLRKNKNNSLSGILGLANDSKGKFKLQGELKFKLVNVFNHLEEFDFYYQSLNNSSQNILLNFTIPYLARTKLGFSNEFELFKRDSSFINIQLKPSVFYSIDYNKQLAINYIFKYSNTINNECNNCSDISFNGFGFSYQNKLLTNKTLIPAETYINLSVNYGILKTNQATENQIVIDGEYIKFHNIQNMHWGGVRFLAGYQNANEFILNNAYRLGGLDNLRGYNQQSIYTDAYALMSLSYYLLPSEIFTTNVFYDAAYVQSPDKKASSFLSSCGIGFGFISNVGLLRLYYAVPLNSTQYGSLISNGKIHVGIITNF